MFDDLTFMFFTRRHKLRQNIVSFQENPYYFSYFMFLFQCSTQEIQEGDELGESWFLDVINQT